MIILILKGHPLGIPYNSLTSFIYLNRGISHMQAQCYLIIDKMFVEIISSENTIIDVDNFCLWFFSFWIYYFVIKVHLLVELITTVPLLVMLQ